MCKKVACVFACLLHILLYDNRKYTLEQHTCIYISSLICDKIKSISDFSIFNACDDISFLVKSRCL